MKTFVIIAAAALSLAPGAQAAPPAPAPTTTVAYADLDLRDAGQAHRMLRRIKSAAAAVCRASPGAGDNSIEAIERYGACVRQAVARGVADLDAPAVTAALQGASTSHEVAWSR